MKVESFLHNNRLVLEFIILDFVTREYVTIYGCFEILYTWLLQAENLCCVLFRRGDK